MGVLNFASRLPQTSPVQINEILLLNGSNYGGVPFPTPDEPVVQQNAANAITPSSKYKRRRTKSASNPQYNFTDQGVDKRRRGSKHQRRLQNFFELQEIAGDGELEDGVFLDNHMTVFAELFLDEEKMKVWEGYIGLDEDKQGQYMEQLYQSNKVVASKKCNKGASDMNDREQADEKYLAIDEKIREMLRSKQLAKAANAENGLLKYYENDVLSCMGDVSLPAVLVFNLEDAYDRMLVYAVCQYMKLSASTIKLKSSTLIEIDVNDENELAPAMTLSKYLENNRSRLL